MPESAHSPNAEELNALYWVLVIVAVALVVAINAALLAFALRFRARRGAEPRRLRSRGPAQALIAGAFALLAALLFVGGVIVTESASEVEASGDDGLQASTRVTAQRSLTPPGGETEPLEVEASGQQWIWRYEYPDGTFTYYELVVPEDTAVVVKLESTDVVHRWWVPGLGGKFDAAPGQSNQTWFKADETGTFEGASYQFSGAAYAAMRTAVRVVTVEEYEAWLAQQASDIEAAQAFVQQQVASDTQLDQPVPEGGGGATEGGTDQGDTPSGGSGSAEGSQ